MTNTPPRSRFPQFRLSRADLVGLSAVLVCILAALIYLFRGGALGSIDSLVGMFPAYDHLGERLRAGELPLWNASLASGTPLAADLQSGWFYLPTMIGFTLFPMQIAALFLSAVHLALAGFGTYAFARILGIAPSGSALASIAYMLSGWFSYRLSCCPSDISTAAWMPILLLFTELALRSEPGGRRTIWRLLSAFSLAQLASAWIGPGSYYVVIAFGAYLLYRTLIESATSPAIFRDRVNLLAGHSLVVGLLTAGLAIGGLLPRIEFYGLSAIGKGYPTGTPDGWGWFRLSERVLGETTWYSGAVTLVLAVFALLVLRRRYLAPFWVALVLFAGYFATRESGIVHDIAYRLLPGFESVQQNLPNRILTISYLGTALLAGGVASEIARWRPTCVEVGAFAGLGISVLAFAYWADGEASTISTRATLPMVITVVVLAFAAFAPGRVKPIAVRAVPLILLLGVAADLIAHGYQEIERQREAGTLSRVDLATYYDPSPAAQWLQQQEGEPFRFAGVDPTMVSETRIGVMPYGRQHGDPMTAALVVNNRAALLGLDDMQSTNFPPMRLAIYDDVLVALNGAPQDYHSAAILDWPALQSPILDLLNVRYVIVPIVDAEGNAPPVDALTGFAEVWSDGTVRILENQDAFARAWLVHDIAAGRENDALNRIADGSLDARTTAVISGADQVTLQPGETSATDAVTIVRERPERLTVRTSSAGDALLVFSELTHPGLDVRIDGRSADVLTVNHAFVGVVVPAGDHEITLSYTGRTEKIGLGISAGVFVFLVGYGVWAGVRHRRRGRDSEILGDQFTA